MLTTLTVAVVVELLLIAFAFLSLMRSIRVRMALSRYAVWLLLSEDLRSEHSHKLDEFLRSITEEDHTTVFLRVSTAIENMASHLTQGDPVTGEGSNVLLIQGLLVERKRKVTR